MVGRVIFPKAEVTNSKPAVHSGPPVAAHQPAAANEPYAAVQDPVLKALLLIKGNNKKAIQELQQRLIATGELTPDQVKALKKDPGDMGPVTNKAAEEYFKRHKAELSPTDQLALLGRGKEEARNLAGAAQNAHVRNPDVTVFQIAARVAGKDLEVDGRHGANTHCAASNFDSTADQAIRMIQKGMVARENSGGVTAPAATQPPATTPAASPLGGGLSPSRQHSIRYGANF